MDKLFVTCIEKIVELEQTSLTQEKTLEAMQKRIDSLGIAKELKAPTKKEATYVSYGYQRISENETYASIGSYAEICGVIGAIIAFLIGLSSSFFGAFGDAIIGGIAGLVAGAIIAIVVNAIKNSEARNQNEQARLDAEHRANADYRAKCEKNEAEYQEQLHKYECLVDFDRERVKNELLEKEYAIATQAQLQKKHEETLNVLKQFYDAADIYPTYRNIVAACHICEYLKSGICTELTGPNGAFMVFKYEMFEKQKIKQLDMVISKLGQLHFDNQILNESLNQIAHRVDVLMYDIQDMKQQIAESARETAGLLQNLGNQFDEYAQTAKRQNAIIAYNQECTTNELNQLKWLEYYKLSCSN